MVQQRGKGAKLGLGTVIGAALVALAAGTPKDASAETATISTTRIPLPTFVSIDCQNPGSSQDVAKTPVLKNTALTTLYKGQRLSWSSSDGDYGQLTLAADLPPGGTVKAMGKAGNAYTCKSSYIAQPDLKIRQAKMVSASQAYVELQNADPYVGAGASSVLFELRACNTSAVIATAKSSALSLSKGEIKSLSFPVAQPYSGKTYVRVVADADKKISESNEINNDWSGLDGCIH